VIDLTKVERTPDDAAECQRLRKMLRALLRSDASAKHIVLVTMNMRDRSDDEMPTITITSPEEMPPDDLAKAVASGFSQFMLCFQKPGD